jgi:hypothetical protein
VRESGADWTIVRPDWFNQNRDEGFFQPAVLAGELALPLGDHRQALVDADDIAAVVAVALTEDGHAGQRYEVTGREPRDFERYAPRRRPGARGAADPGRGQGTRPLSSRASIGKASSFEVCHRAREVSAWARRTARAAGEILQAELAGDHVEAVVGERQVVGAGLDPGDRGHPGGEGQGDGQHARVEVLADHLPGRADPVRGQPGQDPAAAGGVQEALAGGRGGEVEDPGGPGAKMAATSWRW